MEYAMAGVVALVISLLGGGGDSNQKPPQNNNNSNQQQAVVRNTTDVPEPSTIVVSLALGGTLLAYKLKKGAVQKS